MSPGGEARAATVLGPQSWFLTSVLGTGPSKPLPLGQALLQEKSCLTQAYGPCRGRAPAPARVAPGDSDSWRREVGGHHGHPDSAKVMILQTVVALVPGGSWTSIVSSLTPSGADRATGDWREPWGPHFLV